MAAGSVPWWRVLCWRRRILGVDPVEGRFGPDHRAALVAPAATSMADRDQYRALLAAALAIGEEHARHSTTNDAVKHHVEFLASYGYEPSTGDNNAL